MKMPINPLILTTVSGTATKSSLSGTLELDATSANLDVDLQLWVSSPNYVYAGEFMVIESGGHNGIVFMYYDKTDKTKPDSGAPSTQIPVQFTCQNSYSWRAADKVRVMFLNEGDVSVFTGLKPYFELRLSTFGYNLMPQADYDAFNAAWNLAHPNNPVYAPSMAIGMPRFTKDDGLFPLLSR